MSKLEELKIKLLTLQVKKEYQQIQQIEKTTIQKSTLKAMVEELSLELYTYFNNDKKVYDIIDKHFTNLLS